MFCNHCGTQNADSAQFCSGCGKPVIASASASAAQPIATATTPSVPIDAAAPRTDGKATASLICGILSLTFFWILTGIPAIVLGHMSRSDIRKSMGRLKGEGQALAGLIMGYLSLAALPVVLIIAAIAIPNLLRARTAANEASAVASVRRIVTAATAYDREYGNGFPQALSNLTSSPSGTSDASHAGYIDESLANGIKSGYRFEYVSGSNGDHTGFFVRAIPVNPGNTGVRSFCADETGVVRYAGRNQECTANSEALE